MDGEDAYCRHCGAKAGPEPLPVFQSRIGVLLMLFLGIGPFAIPLLWKSPAFTVVEKVWIAALNIAFVVGLVWCIAWLYNYMVFQFSGLIFEPGF